MSGRKLLFDSNVIIYIAKKELAPEAFILPEDVLFLSDVSYMETLGYAFADENEKLETEKLLSVLFRFSIEEQVVQKVIEIRQSRRMKLPDAIIAASALVHDCIVVTRNTSDFSGLPGLAVLNPFDI
ncbi:MAG: type II toxin-antitoxin system VapC family toxin [Saprospiraceae bacterium]|nr:type II toxin-antitoxin system VapC family toxin [Saprospiraceae bacterium]